MSFHRNVKTKKPYIVLGALVVSDDTREPNCVRDFAFNINMTQLNETLYAVLVPAEAHIFWLHMNNLIFRMTEGFGEIALAAPVQSHKEIYNSLSASAKVIGTISNTGEFSFDARSYAVDAGKKQPKLYQNHQNYAEHFFVSLIMKKEIECKPATKILIIEKHTL